MTRALLGKLLRDVRTPLMVVCGLLALYECLWARITARLTEEVLPTVTRHVPLEVLMDVLFKGPGQFIQAILGGDWIDLRNARDVLAVGLVHPFVQTVLCVWGVGRAAGAIAGEIDRGTMELLMSQPVRRRSIIVAHLLADLVIIPILCLSIWGGLCIGIAAFGRIDLHAAADVRELTINPFEYGPALVNAAALVFAVSGVTMAVSAAGRYRGRVMGISVLVILVQFLVNAIGQMWPAAAVMRPFTVFFYYQPQRIVLQGQWTVDPAACWHSGWHLPLYGWLVLTAVGGLGYVLAMAIFSRRDLPAPL
jgi:ABC-2 type transport system permease protein